MLIRLLLLGFLCSVGIEPASAQRAPRGTYSGKEFAAAVTEARKEDQPIAVIFTETESTCPKCYSATEIAFKRMRSKFVLVLADKRVNGKSGGLPSDVLNKTYATYRSKGNVLPIISVFSPDGESVVSGACYRQIAEDERQWLKDIEDEVAKAAMAASAAGGEENQKDGDPMAESEAGSTAMVTWTDVRGREMEAELLGADALKATFKLSSGKVVEVPLGRLSEESRARVEAEG